jgi:hypothetical protein
VFAIFLQVLYYFVQNCTWKHENVSGSRGLSEFLQLLYCFSCITECSLHLVKMSVFLILEFHHSTEINNKSKPQYYCLLYMIYNTRTLM